MRREQYSNVFMDNAKANLKHRLRSRPANLVVVCWTARQWVPGTKKILAGKIVMIGHQFHYDQ